MSNEGIDSSNNNCIKKNSDFKLNALDKLSKSYVFNYSITKLIGEKKSDFNHKRRDVSADDLEESSSSDDDFEEKINEKNENPNVNQGKDVSKAVPIWKEKGKAILNNRILEMTMSVLTIYALFSENLKNLFTNKDADDLFSIICILIIVIFLAEFVLQCLCLENYFYGFYFWMDLVSIFSMFLDIDWLYNVIITGSSSGNSFNKNLKSISAVVRAGKAAKIGSRAIKILRIIRIIRQIRIMKLYKESEKVFMKHFNNKSSKSKSSEMPNESIVGRKLSELTSRRLIILVFIVVMGIIFLDVTFYFEKETSMDYGIRIFKLYNKTDPDLKYAFDIYVKEHINSSSNILFAQIGDLSYGDLNVTLNMRDSEKVISVDDCPGLSDDEDYQTCIAIFDNTDQMRLSNILNIVKTIFICVIFSVGTMYFFKDILEMVVEPIESMISKIKDMTVNPLNALQQSEKDQFLNIMQNETKKNKCCYKKIKKEPLETQVLEKTITKIGALLALGFGEAGSQIIAQNLSNSNGEVNPMIPGKKVIAIYGFCDIRNFTDTTEVLQENVMIFVNEIAQIVHEIASENCGSANKNIGDAFLLIWKFDDELIDKSDPEHPELLLNFQSNQIAESALISFIKIIAKVQKSHVLDKYRKNKELNQRINNYCVKMGFGMHLGWSIEGAIGSVFKIDASYLSPNVNMASKLEEKTKEYGVVIVLSADFVNYLSAEAKKATRIIDIIHMENNDKDVYLYTIDLDLTNLPIEQEITEEKEEEKYAMSYEAYEKLKNYRKRIERNERKKSLMTENQKLWQKFAESNEDFKLMRKIYKPQFYEEYYKGLQEFLYGDWDKSKEHFDQAELILGKQDGPIQHKIIIMKSFDFQKPKGWVNGESGGDHH